MTTVKPEQRIEYEPIQNPSGEGYIALSIYPPGTWFDETCWMVFVGGSGVAKAASLEEAERELLWRGLEACDRRMGYAQRLIDHYRTERAELESEGLKRR
jgi:hypothetical protein